MVGTAAPQKKAFAQGTTDYPVSLVSAGGSLTATASGGNVATLTPVSKTGFVSAFRYTMSGTLTIGTAASVQYTPPLHRLISNYTLQNSLGYPYRSMSGDDLWQWVSATTDRGTSDPIYGSLSFQAPVMTAVATTPYSISWTDSIGQNDGVNFSRFLLSALTTSNDLSILFTFLPIGSISQLEQHSCVITGYTATIAVSCEYLTVPPPSEYYWPDTSRIQQVLGDPSFVNTAVGLNSVNLTPIQGPEFMGIGLQIVGSGGATDSLAPGTSGVSQVQITVNGTIPLKTYSLTDLLQKYERLFGRQPNYGYLYIDLCSDLSIANVMSHTHRKVLSTAKYAQISLLVTLNANYTPGAGARIGVLKRTQQRYSQNA